MDNYIYGDPSFGGTINVTDALDASNGLNNIVTDNIVNIYESENFLDYPLEEDTANDGMLEFYNCHFDTGSFDLE